MLHGHAHSHAPVTEGRMIRWARLYDTSVQLMTLGQSKRLRAATIEAAQIRVGETVLDVGCGTGDLTRAAKRAAGESGTVYGVDAAPEMIDVARRKADEQRVAVEFRVEAIEQLDLPNNSMDIVLSSLMMHHLPGDLKRRGLQEVWRVLNPGGRLLIVDLKRPTGAIEKMLSHLMMHGSMERGVQDLVGILQAGGFEEVEFWHAPFPMLGFVRGRKGMVTR